MKDETIKIRISGHPEISVPKHSNLSEVMDIENSPLLFGCRTGICGTCLITCEPGEHVGPHTDEEQVLLPIIAPGNPKARLACQLSPQGDITVSALQSE